jgi:hypothetical protein
MKILQLALIALVSQGCFNKAELPVKRADAVSIPAFKNDYLELISARKKMMEAFNRIPPNTDEYYDLLIAKSESVRVLTHLQDQAAKLRGSSSPEERMVLVRELEGQTGGDSAMMEVLKELGTSA